MTKKYTTTDCQELREYLKMDSGSWLVIPSIEKSIACNVTTVDKIVCTACALHDWLTNSAVGTYRQEALLTLNTLTEVK
jgi:hypothetical protein